MFLRRSQGLMAAAFWAACVIDAVAEPAISADGNALPAAIIETARVTTDSGSVDSDAFEFIRYSTRPGPVTPATDIRFDRTDVLPSLADVGGSGAGGRLAIHVAVQVPDLGLNGAGAVAKVSPERPLWLDDQVAGSGEPNIDSVAVIPRREIGASLSDLAETSPWQGDVPGPKYRSRKEPAVMVDFFPAESLVAERTSRFPSFGLEAAAELPAPDAGSGFGQTESLPILVEVADPESADPWTSPQTSLWKAPTDILADGSSIGLAEGGGLPPEAIAVIDAIRVARFEREEVRRLALMADIDPVMAGEHANAERRANWLGWESLELAYHRQFAAGSGLADIDTLDVSGAIVAVADMAAPWSYQADSIPVADRLGTPETDVDNHPEHFTGDLDPTLLTSPPRDDIDVASLVITYPNVEAKWGAASMLAASLPRHFEPYAHPSVLASLDVAESRSFEDGTTELPVPGLSGRVGQSIDTIAVARAADREAPDNRVAPENRVQLALLGSAVRDDRPVDIGDTGLMVATAAASDGDGAYPGDIVIRPAAQSLLGGDLDGGDMSGAATVSGDVRSLRGAVALALETNPEIGQASANRQAIEFELAQGRGNYLPSVDLEARAGVQVTDNPTTRRNGDDDRAFAPVEGRITVTQLLFDGFATDAEVERQASRVDGASYRVWERSEFIALNVIRAHQDVHRLVQILGLAQENLSFHRKVLDDISEGTRAGAISVADRQQAEERIISARAFITDTREELEAARITFNRLVGQFPAKTEFAPPIASHLPPSLDHAIGTARANSPTVKIVDAAISQAYAEYKGAESGYLPTLNLELIGRAGEDLDGIRGRDAELRAMLVLKWNLYAGGVKPAGVQQRIRRIDEARMNLHIAQRDAEETMRISWDRWVKQRERLAQLEQQLAQSTRLLGSYREQYGIGRRSLLDVLDTQNTRFGTQVAVVTSRHAVRFAEYRILAAAGKLLETLGIEPPATAEAYARADAGVPVVPEPETFSRSTPSRP